MSWKNLKNKSIQLALIRAIDSLADLIEIIEYKKKNDKIDTIKIKNIIHKLHDIVNEDV